MLPWYLITGSAHKAANWKEALATKGVVGDVLNVRQHSPEPSTLCAWKVATGKLKSFMGEASAVALDMLGLDHVNLAIMDINGIIPPARGKAGETLTTCRGAMSSGEKIALTAQELLARRTDRDNGVIVYMNICGYGKYREGQLENQGAVYESAKLTVSGPLLRALCSPDTLAQICDVTAQVEVDTGRTFMNANSIGGMDASMLPFIVPVLANELDINAWVSWEDGKGATWVANREGVTHYMRRHMKTHLRGFPDRVVEHVAALPN